VSASPQRKSWLRLYMVIVRYERVRSRQFDTHVHSSRHLQHDMRRHQRHWQHHHTVRRRGADTGLHPLRTQLVGASRFHNRCAYNIPTLITHTAPDICIHARLLLDTTFTFTRYIGLSHLHSNVLCMVSNLR